jgi:hypothetical protein
MAEDSRYDAKIIKYLDAKRGRAYQLGPELVSNGGLDSSTGWTLESGWSITGGRLVGTAATATYAYWEIPGNAQAGKSYLLSFQLVSITSSNMAVKLGAGGFTTNVQYPWNTTTGTLSMVLVPTALCGRLAIQGGGGGFSGVVDNVSLREVLL